MRRFLPVLVLLLSVSTVLLAQPHVPVFNPVGPIAFDTSGPVIRAHTETLKPFTVAGERGVLVGQQDGTFEAWLLPVKVLSHLTIEADVEGYTVPIDVNKESAEIEVRADRTVITYAHPAFTVRQIMFSPADGPRGTGPVVLFEFDCLHPTDFTFRFTPDLLWMWPRRNDGVPEAEWVAPGPNPHNVAGGFYVLHSDYPDFAAALTIPGARPGILAPYQERPQVHPVELKLHIDPAQDRGKLYPLLMAYGASVAEANSGSLAATLEKLDAEIPSLYQSQSETYKKMVAESLSIRTPDKSLNEAFQWAEISIEQLKTRALPDNETALVAGYYASGDSARPGFGWFFGRDALYTLYAVNGYGDFALSKSELEFLLRRQRDDGKIMHEWSQTAPTMDWRAFPYMYAAADATPLFLLATLDYVRASGDVDFLTAHREALEKAWAFETGHTSDNGIYDNTQGTGWVESWPGGMPHQEVYLAALDQQASAAMAQIESLLHDAGKAKAASDRAAAIAKTINEQFYDADKGCYAFSRNANGSLDRTTTVYPALAWWSLLPGTGSPSGANSILAHPEGCLRQFAGAALNTDWGLRDVSNQEKIYDGMSYHQGSVWPLFTGWAALAEYRGGQPLAGYQMLMENANLTWAQDLGSDTELLSGDYFVPFGRSTSHQLWSSAMVITPTLRGLFGIDVDAQSKTVTVNPHLPANWDHAEIQNLRVGNETVDLSFVQSKGETTVSLSGSQSGVKLVRAGENSTGERSIRVARPAVAVVPFYRKPSPGDRTVSVRVLSEAYNEHQLTLTLEGLAGSQMELPLVLSAPAPKLRAEGAALAAQPHHGTDGTPVQFPAISVAFPPGDGWKTITVTLNW